MSDRLKIGITNTSYGVYSFEDAIKRIAENGYDHIDYQGFVDIESDFFNLDKEAFSAELLRQKAIISSHGLTVSQAHAPWRTPRDNDPKERKRWLAAMKKSIYGASVLECPRFIVHPLMPYMDTDQGKDEVWAMNEVFIAELADCAKEYGVTVCVENLPFPVYPLATVEAVCELVDKLDRDNLKVCLDTGHAAIFTGSDVASAVRYIGKRLEAMHVHDNMGKEDEHLIPGDGIIDWDGYTKALKEIGFDKVFSLETSPKHKLHPEREWQEREIALAKLAMDLAKKAK